MNDKLSRILAGESIREVLTNGNVEDTFVEATKHEATLQTFFDLIAEMQDEENKNDDYIYRNNMAKLNEMSNDVLKAYGAEIMKYVKNLKKTLHDWQNPASQSLAKMSREVDIIIFKKYQDKPIRNNLTFIELFNIFYMSSRDKYKDTWKLWRTAYNTVFGKGVFDNMDVYELRSMFR